MRTVLLLLLATTIVATAQAQCASCSAIETKFTEACESHVAAMAEVAERHPDKFKYENPKHLRASAPGYCKCVLSKNEQMLPGDLEIIIELFSMQEKSLKLMASALSGNTEAKRDHEILETRTLAFAQKATRMIGSNKLEKSNWLADKFCAPMIDKFVGGPK